MRMRLKTIMAGPDGCHQPGDEIDGNPLLVEQGYAEALEPMPARRARRRVGAVEAETTSLLPAETATTLPPADDQSEAAAASGTDTSAAAPAAAAD